MPKQTTPLHMERVAGNNIEKSNKQEKISENEDLVPKWKATSVIWNYFSYEKDDIDQTCVLCVASVATTRRNTTNLFDHL